MSALRPVCLVPLLLSATLCSCCKREWQAQHPSPSGARVLTLVRVNCGAFDSFHTEARLGRPGAAGAVVASISSAPVVQVAWVGDSLVQIFAPQRYARDLKKADYDGVHIEFR